jgi:signal transduction histidine kinase
MLRKDLALKDVLIKQRGIVIFASIACGVFLIVLVYLLYNGNKKKAGLNQILSNKNEEIEAQKLKIEDQNSDLTVLNRTKNQLLATIGHDIKGPLTSIYAMLRFVNDDLITLDEQKEMFGNLQIQVGNVTEMVGNLLDWSKSQIGGFKANPVDVDISKLVDKQQQLFLPKLEAKEITLELKPGDYPIAKVDIEHVRIVVRNLLSNAIKFTDHGGRITVSVLSVNDAVGIAVADNGVGISEVEIDHLLLNKSASTSKLGTENEKGSGLGLMLSISLIEDNGGSLEVQSELGKGSVFTVWLPKAKM